MLPASEMVFLVLSLTALALAPALVQAAQGRVSLLAALDGFVVTAVAGLVLLHILPLALAEGGLWAIPAAVLGFLVPGLFEHRLARRQRHGHGHGGPGHAHAHAHDDHHDHDHAEPRTSALFFVLILAGLGLHALVDGAAIALPDAHGHADDALGLGVVLHRLPLAMALWSLARPAWGKAWAGGVLGFMGALTTLGFILAETVLHDLPSGALGVVQAGVGGGLLHLLIGHRLAPLVTATPARLAAGVGALAGLAVQGLIILGEPLPPTSYGPSSGQSFAALAVVAAPWWLLAYALSAALAVAMGRRRAASAGLLGLPLCACGVRPRVRRAALPSRAAWLSLVVLAAGLALDATLGAGALLGPVHAVVRVVAFAAAAGLVLVLATRRSLAPTLAAPPQPVAPPALLRELAAALDHAAPWLVTGLLLASMLEAVIDPAWVAALPIGGAIVALGLLGVVVYLCPVAAVPVLAVLVHKGLPPGAALAFAITSAAAGLALVSSVGERVGRAAAAAYLAVVVAVAVAAGVLADDWLRGAAAVDLHAVAADLGDAVRLLPAAVLLALVLWSLARQGPRGFVGQVVEQWGTEPHEHHGHPHGDAEPL